MPRLKKLIRAYQTAGIIFFNTFVLFVVLNVGLYGLIKIRELSLGGKNHFTPKYHEALTALYPDLNGEEIKNLIAETRTGSSMFEFEPFTQFRMRPFSGTYVKIDRNGFRLTKNQGPWPPNRNFLNVFMFGGSTTFGYGLPDHQTLASHLQDLLSDDGVRQEVKIYNFGRNGYYSTQERILFEKLLAAGFYVANCHACFRGCLLASRRKSGPLPP
jgi:hypothetical protein